MKIALNNKKRLSLTTRYTATIFSLSIAGMLVLACILFYKQVQQNSQYVFKLGEMVARQLAFSIDDLIVSGNQKQLHDLIEEYVSEYSIKGVAILDSEGLFIDRAGKIPERAIARQHEPVFTLPFKKGDGLFRLGGQFIIHNHPVYHENLEIGQVMVVFSYRILYEDFNDQLLLMITITFILVLLVSLGAFRIGRQLSTPIHELLSATRSIQAGQIDQIPESRNDEIGSLVQYINRMSQGLIRKSELEKLLQQFLTRDVADKVIDQLDPIRMTGEHVEATVLFADMVGFTGISEDISPEDVQELLNEYYGYFNACARFYFGNVDKYIGDCVMIVFGAPKEDPKHQYHAVACAILMQKLAEKLNEKRRIDGLFPIELRIGINTGKMLAGLIGSNERMEYTVVGDAVNLASRLCNEANSAQIIIEESLYHAINPSYRLDVEMYKSIRVRGKKDKVSIYSVKNIEQPFRVALDDLIDDILSN